MSSAREHRPKEGTANQIDPQRLVFVGGLHRSGTTVLGRVLADHPEISGFSNTGALEDEGQHLQSAYAPARHHGGPGRFARAPEAHLTEAPVRERQDLAERLLADWSPHWDLGRRLLVEKSPPNMIMGRYLQSIFPGSALIVILRHPVVVALSTKKWTPLTSLPDLVDHWCLAHDILLRDAPALPRLHLIRYEDLMANPRTVLSKVENFLGLSGELDTQRLEASRSNRYVDAWENMASGSMVERRRRRQIERKCGDRIHEYGYRWDDLTTLAPWSWGKGL